MAATSHGSRMPSVASTAPSSSVPTQYFPSPFNEVLDSLAGRLRTDPQLKVLCPVVGSVPVLVVDVLTGIEQSTDCRFDHDAMFEDVSGQVCCWVVRGVHPDVAESIDEASAEGAQHDIGRAVPSDPVSVRGAVPGAVRRFGATIGGAGFVALSVAIPVDVVLAAHAAGKLQLRVLATGNRAHLQHGVRGSTPGHDGILL